MKIKLKRGTVLVWQRNERPKNKQANECKWSKQGFHDPEESIKFTRKCIPANCSIGNL